MPLIKKIKGYYKKNNNFGILFNGLIFILIYYAIFSIIYFYSKPIHVNNLIVYGTLIIYLITITAFIIYTIKEIKNNKKIIIFLLVLSSLFLFKIMNGTIYYRDAIYSITLKKLSHPEEDFNFIRLFGLTQILVLSKIIFKKISWNTFNIISYLINFLGLLATYLIAKKEYKKELIAYFPALLILSNFWISFYLGCEEPSSFAISFIMIAYYFVIKKNFLLSLCSIISAILVRIELFLFFPFFIVQYCYYNSINVIKNINIIKNIKRIIKKKNIVQKVPILLLYIFLFYIFMFIITNTAHIYSETYSLEVAGPNTPGEKEVFKYIKYHLIYNIKERIKENLLFLIQNAYFNDKKILSGIFTTIFLISSIALIRKKFIQISAFNVLFFFITYVILRYEGLTYGKGNYKYLIYFIYFISIIIPSILSKIKNSTLRNIELLVIIALYISIIININNTYKVYKDYGVYYPLKKSEIKEIYNKIRYNDCNVIFITRKNPLIFYKFEPKKTKFVNPFLSNKEAITEIIDEKNNKSCLYVILPTTKKLRILPDFYTVAITEGWCKNEKMCKQKLIEIRNFLIENNFTEVIHFNKSKDDLGGIFYYEKIVRIVKNDQ